MQEVFVSLAGDSLSVNIDFATQWGRVNRYVRVIHDDNARVCFTLYYSIES